MSDREKNGKVSWTIFAWAIGVLTISIAVSISYANSASSKADQAIQNASDVNTYATSIDSRTTAQFAEIMRSLERLERANGIKK